MSIQQQNIRKETIAPLELKFRAIKTRDESTKTTQLESLALCLDNTVNAFCDLTVDEE